MAAIDDAVAHVRLKLAEFGTAAVTDDDIKWSLWEAYQMFCRQTNAILSPVYTQATTAGQTEYKLPQFTAANGKTAQNVYRVTSLELDDEELDYVDPVVMDVTTMKIWTMPDAMTIIISPEPQEGQTLKLRGYETPAEDNGYAWGDGVPEFFYDCIEDGACVRLLPRVLPDDGSQLRGQVLADNFRRGILQARADFRRSIQGRHMGFIGVFRL
jgi:hypothetical protein